SRFLPAAPRTLILGLHNCPLPNTPHASSLLRTRHRLGISSQSNQRKILPIQSVNKIKHPRETRPRSLRLIPPAVSSLCAEQISNPPRHRITPRIARSQQPHHTP